MRRYTYATTTDITPATLFTAISAVERWPEWDGEIEATHVVGTLAPGSRFTLKPKGGPRVAMTVAAMERPFRFADIAHMPLAKMRTDHRFEPTQTGTRMTVEIRVSGPLAFLWDRIVACKQAAGAEQQAAAFIAFARRLA